MKKAYFIIWILSALALASCSQRATQIPLPTVILDPSSSSSGGSGTTVSASGQVVPINKVNLSFPLIGTVKTIEVEIGDTVNAGDALVALDTAILEAKVAEAEANVAVAETQVRYLRRVGPGDEQLKAAEAEVERAMAGVEQAKAILEQAVLKAPISGTVVAVELAPGETVIPGQVVIIIGDLTNMRIETTDLSEQDVPAVQIGQTAAVFIDALNQEFSGEVVDISHSSETIGGDVVYKVTVELNEQPDGLRWGMSAEVKIQPEP